MPIIAREAAQTLQTCFEPFLTHGSTECGRPTHGEPSTGMSPLPLNLNEG